MNNAQEGRLLGKVVGYSSGKTCNEAEKNEVKHGIPFLSAAQVKLAFLFFSAVGRLISTGFHSHRLSCANAIHDCKYILMILLSYMFTWGKVVRYTVAQQFTYHFEHANLQMNIVRTGRVKYRSFWF